MSILLNTTIPFSIVVTHCDFKENKAFTVAGGFYIALNGYLAFQTVVDRVIVEGNRILGKKSSAAGCYIGFFGATNHSFVGRNVGVYNSLFVDNVGRFGGGIYLQVLTSCKFLGNRIV